MPLMLIVKTLVAMVAVTTMVTMEIAAALAVTIPEQKSICIKTKDKDNSLMHAMGLLQEEQAAPEWLADGHLNLHRVYYDTQHTAALEQLAIRQWCEHITLTLQLPYCYPHTLHCPTQLSSLCMFKHQQGLDILAFLGHTVTPPAQLHASLDTLKHFLGKQNACSLMCVACHTGM